MSTPPPPPPGAMPPPPPPPPPGSNQGYNQGFPPATPGYQAPGYQAPGYQPYGQMSPVQNFAGAGSRFGGLLIDHLIGVLFTVPAVIIAFAGPRHIVNCTINDEARRCNVPTGGTIGIAVVVGLIGLAAFIVLYTRKLGKGATWGQKAVGVRCVDMSTGEPIGTGRAVGRFFAMYLSTFLCYLGFFWALWDGKKQTWHDKLVSSVVVKN